MLLALCTTQLYWADHYLSATHQLLTHICEGVQLELVPYLPWLARNSLDSHEIFSRTTSRLVSLRKHRLQSRTLLMHSDLHGHPDFGQALTKQADCLLALVLLKALTLKLAQKLSTLTSLINKHMAQDTAGVNIYGSMALCYTTDLATGGCAVAVRQGAHVHIHRSQGIALAIICRHTLVQNVGFSKYNPLQVLSPLHGRVLD